MTMMMKVIILNEDMQWYLQFTTAKKKRKTFGISTGFEPIAGSAAVLYHLSYEDPRIEEQNFFFQIKPGLFVLFSQFTSFSIMTMIMMMMMTMMIMMMIMVMRMIMIII